jgi:hypothetical protein
VVKKGKGHYYKNQNIENQKESQKNFEASEHQKVSFSSSLIQQSERQKCLFSSSLLRQSECQKEHQNSEKLTFDVLILPIASKKIRMSKIENINYLWRITHVYQGLGGLGKGQLG